MTIGSVAPRLATGANDVLISVVAQQEKGGPLGPEFGKASPVGLFVILSLLVVVILLGVSANKRVKRLNRRKAIAEQEGIDVFDTEALDAAIARRGLTDVNAAHRFPETRFGKKPHHPGGKAPDKKP